MAKKTKRMKNGENIKIALQNNIRAMNLDTKVRWDVRDIKNIKPLNFPQRIMFKSFFSGNHIVADGSAGTGKTYARLYLALSTVLSTTTPQTNMMIVRSVVASRELGFLPGTLDEKLQVYETPYIDMIGDLLNNHNAYQSLKMNNTISFTPTSFVRGLTWDDAVIVIDEVQNMNFNEINSVITRTGNNSKLIICGDYIQNDLLHSRHDVSGIAKFLKIIKTMSSFDYIKFSPSDIVRSEFVKEWIVASELYD